MQDKDIESICELIDRRTKKQILKEARNELIFSKASRCQYAISFAIAVVLGILIGESLNTIAIMNSVIEWVSNTLIAFISIIFGSYAIFQALLNKEVVAELLKAKGNLLKESNRTFLNLTILYAVYIIFNFILMVILKVIPENFCLLPNLRVTNSIADIVITIYLFGCIMLLSEIINFAINFYRMFCVHNSLKALDSLDDEENKD